MSEEFDKGVSNADSPIFDNRRNLSIISRLINIRQQIRLKARSAAARAESYKNQTQPSSFQEHQEDVAKEKLEQELRPLQEEVYASIPGKNESVAKWEQYYKRLMQVSTMYLGVQCLSRQDAQWLANKSYSCNEKAAILFAVGDKEMVRQEVKMKRQIKKAFGCLAIAAGVTAGTAAVAGNSNVAVISGLLSFSTIIPWLNYQSSIDGVQSGHVLNQAHLRHVSEKDPNIKRGLQRLAPYVLQER